MEHTLADRAAFIGNMINCTGAQTCKLGICLPRGLSDALRDEFAASNLNLDAIPEFTLNMSGCPNTCGMHHIADLGFFGKIGRKDGNLYPAYNVLAGAQTGAGRTRYAQKEGELPAHAVPKFGPLGCFRASFFDPRQWVPKEPMGPWVSWAHPGTP